MRTAAAVLAALLLAGCSPISADIVKALSSSTRSWCTSVTTIYGTLKMGGTGLPVGKMNCNGEGWSIDANAPQGMASGGVQALPNGIILLPPVPPEPKLYRQDPPSYQLVPAPTPAPPAVKPQSGPAAFAPLTGSGAVQPARWMGVLDASEAMQR